MSEESNGKKFSAMTPAERDQTMHFMVDQQAQFFADLEAMKEIVNGLLTVDARHQRRLERVENIIRSALVIGRRERSRIRVLDKEAAQRQEQVHADLDAVRELLLDNARHSGENQRDIAELRQATSDAVRELLLDNARHSGENQRDIAELRQATARNTEARGALTAAIATLVERKGTE